MPTDASNLSSLPASSSRAGKKFFTLAEANRALSYVSRVAEDISGTYGRLMDCRRKLESPGAGESREHLEAEYEATMEKLSGYIDELQVLGVELKDFEMVLVDFPCIHEDREIHLCWHRGEQEVVAWHEVNAGYAGRQDVSLLSAEAKV